MRTEIITVNTEKLDAHINAKVWLAESEKLNSEVRAIITKAYPLLSINEWVLLVRLSNLPTKERLSATYKNNLESGVFTFISYFAKTVVDKLFNQKHPITTTVVESFDDHKPIPSGARILLVTSLANKHDGKSSELNIYVKKIK